MLCELHIYRLAALADGGGLRTICGQPEIIYTVPCGCCPPCWTGAPLTERDRQAVACSGRRTVESVVALNYPLHESDWLAVRSEVCRNL